MDRRWSPMNINLNSKHVTFLYALLVGSLVGWLARNSSSSITMVARRFPGATSGAKPFPKRTIVNRGNETTRNGEVLLFPPILGDGRW